MGNAEPDSGTPMDSEKRQQLLDLFKQFAKDAMKDQPCEWVDGEDGEIVTASYKLSGDMSAFHLAPEGGLAQMLEIKQIQDVTQDIQRTSLVAGRLSWGLSEEDRATRFVCLQYTVNG